MDTDNKPMVAGLPTQGPAKTDRNPAGFQSTYLWPNGNIQNVLNVSSDSFDKALAEKGDGQGKGWADLVIIPSLPPDAQHPKRGADRFAKDGSLVKRDITPITRQFYNSLRDLDINVDVHAVEKQISWLFNCIKAGLDVKAEYAELKAAAKHAIAVAKVEVPAPAVADEAQG